MKKSKGDNEVSEVVSRIVKAREDKGYSLENMANELGLSISAYNKIEKLQTKLTLERLFQIQVILETSLQDLLSINGETFYHQNMDGNSIGYQAGVQHLYQDNKELTEGYIQSLREENSFLKKMIEKTL